MSDDGATGGRIADGEARGEPRGTLVVVPVTLLANWKAEAAKLLPRGARVKVVDSAAKRSLSLRELKTFDLVVTAYTLLADSPVMRVPWHRLVLDESQWVRHRSTVACQLARDIEAPRRWALSGTPCPTSIADLSGQLWALRLPGYEQPNLFTGRCRPRPRPSPPAPPPHPTGARLVRRRLDPAGNERWVGAMDGAARLSEIVAKVPEVKEGLTRFLFEIILRRMEVSSYAMLCCAMLCCAVLCYAICAWRCAIARARSTRSMYCLTSTSSALRARPSSTTTQRLRTSARAGGTRSPI